MGGGDLNLKKSWHPNTLKNQEKVWKAEQAKNEEDKKLVDLRKQIDEEKNREKLKKIGVSSGVLSGGSSDKLEWMYKSGSDLINRDEYLLGRRIDKSFEVLQAEEQRNKESMIPGYKKSANHVEHECIPASIRDYHGEITEQVDLQRKEAEDPLMAIKQRELESRKKLLENPVKLKELHRLLKSEGGSKFDNKIYKKLKKSKKEKKEKKDKKSKKAKKSKKSKAKKSHRKDITSNSESDVNLDKEIQKRYKKLKKNIKSTEDINFCNDLTKMLGAKYEFISKELDKTAGNESKSKKTDRSRKRSRSISERRKNVKRARRTTSSSSFSSDEMRKSKSNTRSKLAQIRTHKSTTKDISKKSTTSASKSKFDYHDKSADRQRKSARSKSPKDLRYELDKFVSEKRKSKWSNRSNSRDQRLEQNKDITDKDNSSRNKVRHHSDSSDEVRISTKKDRSQRDRSYDKNKYNDAKYTSGRSNRSLSKSKSYQNNADYRRPRAKRSTSRSVTPHKYRHDYDRNYKDDQLKDKYSHETRKERRDSERDYKDYPSKDKYGYDTRKEHQDSARDYKDYPSKDKYGYETRKEYQDYQSKDKHGYDRERKDYKPKEISASVSSNKLTAEEKEQRLREMMHNAAWREEDRTRSVHKHREEYAREEEGNRSRDFDKQFINKEIRKAMDNHKTVGSRIQTNMNNIQRSTAAMNANFARK